MKFDLTQIIEKFNQLDEKIRYGAFAGLLLLILLVDVFTVLGFQLGALSKMSEDNQTLKQDIERVKGDMQRIDQIKGGLQNSRSQLESMNAQIRSTRDVSNVLEQISMIANEGKLKIEQINPQGDIQPLITAGNVKYYALPIVIQASSGYHVFGHFLSRLESQKLLFSLSQLTIEDRATDARNHGVSATLKVVLSDKNTDGQVK